MKAKAYTYEPNYAAKLDAPVQARTLAATKNKMKTLQTNQKESAPETRTWLRIDKNSSFKASTPETRTVALDGTLPRVFVNGRRFEILSEVGAELIIRRPNGSKQYRAKRLGNEQIHCSNRAQIIEPAAPQSAKDPNANYASYEQDRVAKREAQSPQPAKAAQKPDGRDPFYLSNEVARCLYTIAKAKETTADEAALLDRKAALNTARLLRARTVELERVKQQRDAKQKQLNTTFLQLSGAEQQRDELLVACKAVDYAFSNYRKDYKALGYETIKMVRTAIAKAEGGMAQ